MNKKSDVLLIVICRIHAALPSICIARFISVQMCGRASFELQLCCKKTLWHYGRNSNSRPKMIARTSLALNSITNKFKPEREALEIYIHSANRLDVAMRLGAKNSISKSNS